MADDNIKQWKEGSHKGAGHRSDELDPYDPFEQGRFPVGVRTIQALDTARHRLFPCEIWYPAAEVHAGQGVATETPNTFAMPLQDTSRSQTAVRDAATRTETYPLIIYSHPSGGNRRAATFLCTHLSSHGYFVAALDHSELVAPELARSDDETDEQKAARTQAWITNRVPDISFLIAHLLNRVEWDSQTRLDPTRVGIIGHSFGGWTALAATDVESSIRAVVALAPGGSSNPKPGIIPVKLTFGWGRDVPTLYLVAENDISMPLAGMYELFERTPSTKLMVVLRRADHLHFMDNVEQVHETVRSMKFSEDLAWIPKEMRPIEELCSGEQAHMIVRGLTLCHLDAVLRKHEQARRFLMGDLETDLAARGLEVIVHR